MPGEKPALSNTRRFMPDARRRFEELRRRPYFDFMLLADREFGARVLEARDALRAEMGLEAILALRKAEDLYEAIAWPEAG